MIVSDQHRFVFVHIPKCAGSSVRQDLQRYDETGGRFDRRIEELPSIGRVDMTHLPLAALVQIAPEVHAKLLSDYASYAVLRDPHARFPSAMAQHLKMFGGTEMAQMDTRTLRREVDRVMVHLAAHPDTLAPEFIHFRRQVDFVVENGHRRVRHLYRQDQLAACLADIAARIGVPPPDRVRHTNRTYEMRSPALRAPAVALARMAKTVMPGTAHARLRQRMRRMLMKRTQNTRSDVFDNAEIRTFVDAHYAEDLALWRSVAAAERVSA